jgi:multicomponent Na+:H+ antiporter subunit E
MIFALNVVLALAWAALLGAFSVQGFAAGFVVGFVALWLARPVLGPTRYFRKALDVVRLAGLFLKELALSSLRVVYDVLTPQHRSRPGVVAVPMHAQSDLEITVFANLVSLTPGTLALDVGDDRRVLFVHAMFVDDPEMLRRDIKDGMERRVLEVLR